MIAHLPVKDNPKLTQILEAMDRHGLQACWRLADLNSLRAGVNDHGPTHVRIVAHTALTLFRLLDDAGVAMTSVSDHGLGKDDAQVIVALAALLHDLGMEVHRDSHEFHSLFLVHQMLMPVLADFYDPATRVTVMCETLHAMIGHNSHQQCLTVEAGIVKLADALDMTKWRSRAIIKQGRVSIHSLSAAAIDRVNLGPGKAKPVGVEIVMNNSAGIFQVDSLLKHKLLKSGIQDYVEVAARIEGTTEKQLLSVYNL